MPTQQQQKTQSQQTETILKAEDVTVSYDDFAALRGVYMDVPRNQVTALI